MNQTVKRHMAYQRGCAAEAQAAAYLQAEGFDIVAQRYKTAYGEIDLIASRADLLLFVEVKARKRSADASASISLRQQQRITRAAELYVSEHPVQCDLRFDVITIDAQGQLTHMPHAWDMHVLDGLAAW